VADLLIVGDCNPDLVLAGGAVEPAFGQRERRVDDARLLPGGSGAITACGAARLGLETAFVGAIGDDPLGRFMLEALADRGVDASGCVVDPAAATGVTVALLRGDDRAMLTAPGAMSGLRAEQIDRALLLGARHLHVASYFLLDGLRPELPALVAEARAAGVTVSLDPQGDPTGDWRSGLPELLPELDLLLVNEQEAAALLPTRCPLVVTKRGARGASARSPLGTVDVPAPVVEVVDATGAGDSFDAGFLAGWLAGLPLEQALRLGCACGALSTRALGGTAAQPTLDEARAAIA
jgi:sugar/nucleoside kinase (ribokinase family)